MRKILLYLVVLSSQIFVFGQVTKQQLLVHPKKTLTIVFPSNIDSAFGGGFAMVADGKTSQSGNADYVMNLSGRYLTLMVRESKDEEDVVPARNFSAVCNDQLYAFDCIPVPIREDAQDTLILDATVSSEIKKSESSVIEPSKYTTKPQSNVKRGNPEVWITMLTRVEVYSGIEVEMLKLIVGLKDELLVAVHDGSITDNYEYIVETHMIIRQKPYDALAFACTVTNVSDKSLYVDPEGVSVRVGNAVYRQVTSLFEFRSLQPGESRKIFFVIDGDADGKPTYLRPDNEFLVSLDIIGRDEPLKIPFDEKSKLRIVGGEKTNISKPETSDRKKVSAMVEKRTAREYAMGYAEYCKELEDFFNFEISDRIKELVKTNKEHPSIPLNAVNMHLSDLYNLDPDQVVDINKYFILGVTAGVLLEYDALEIDFKGGRFTCKHIPQSEVDTYIEMTHEIEQTTLELIQTIQEAK